MKFKRTHSNSYNKWMLILTSPRVIKLVTTVLSLLTIFFCLKTAPFHHYHVDETVDGLPRGAILENHAVHNKQGVLVIVPGLGDPQRLGLLQRSVQNLAQSMQEPTAEYTFHCEIYVWNQTLFAELWNTSAVTGITHSSRETPQENDSPQQPIPPTSFTATWNQQSPSSLSCRIIYNVGLWTHHMKRVNLSAYDNNNVTRVLLLMDDIDASAVQFNTFLQIMQSAQYNVASAAIPQWHYRAMHNRRLCLAHRTDYVDMLFTVFDKNTWECWQSKIDVDANDYGWGYDVTLHDMCHNATIGVIDTMRVTHQGQCENGGDCTRSYNSDAAMKKLWQWIASVKNYANEQQAKDYWKYVTKERPNHFRHCDIYNNKAVKKKKETNAK